MKSPVRLLRVALFLTGLTTTQTAWAQSTDAFSETVIALTNWKLKSEKAEITQHTGFCVDPACRFVATTYHSASILGKPRKLKGKRVVELHLATGPADTDATLNQTLQRDQPPQYYTLSRDIGIFELDEPLPKHHGLSYSAEPLNEGQQVEIYTFPKTASVRHKRELRCYSAKYKGETTTGLLAFDYEYSDGRSILPGASGGIVVDRRSKQIVGMLNGVEINGLAVATAVPVQSIADFMAKIHPFVAVKVFPSIKMLPPFSGELYPKLQTASYRSRPGEESREIEELRRSAQIQADGLKNFIAVEHLSWGLADHEPNARSVYELRMIDGKEQYRLFPDGKKEVDEIPSPADSVTADGVWSSSLAMVGNERNLTIHRAADAFVNAQRMKIFQFAAAPEDDACTFVTYSDYVVRRTQSEESVACYGEVWTDENSNILRISEHYEMPGRWKEYQDVVTFGWFTRAGEPPHLIPLTFSAQGLCRNRIYWCRGFFSNYQEFSARVRLVTN